MFTIFNCTITRAPRLMPLLKVVFFVCTSAMFLACAQGQEINNPTSEYTGKVQKIDSLVNLYYDYQGFNGSVLVSHQGEVIYKKGFGMANFELDVPNTPQTKFRIASVTKPFTAILIMQLAAQNVIDLNAPISTYLKDYPLPQGDLITIHHLLNHSAGVVREYESRNQQNRFPDRMTPGQMIQDFWDLPLEFTPGEKFTYSNSGYGVLGYLIETVTGKSYQQVLEEQILTPVGMENTGSNLHRPIIKNRANGYFKGFGDYFNTDYDDLSNITAIGNLYATVEDLFLLDQALYTETLMPKAYLDAMLSKTIVDPSFGGHYGYGWELIDKPLGSSSETVATNGHSGSMGGFTTLYTRIPQSNSSIIFMNNTGRAFLNAMTTAITGILYDQPYDFPLKPLAMFMDNVIELEGIDKGIQFYEKHQDHPEYYKSEQELIVAGYRLLHGDNAKDAAKIFKLSIQVFPDRYNPYDSYAEALMTLGNNKEAIKYYKKSLEINPENLNAVRMLEKLEAQ